jgi:hypothetical protein
MPSSGFIKQQILSFLFIGFLVFYYAQPIPEKKINQSNHSTAETISQLRSAIIFEEDEVSVNGKIYELQFLLNKLDLRDLGFEEFIKCYQSHDKKACLNFLNKLQNQILMRKS